MKVKSNSYNILSIKLDASYTASSSQKIEGTMVDYNFLKKLTDKSGLIKVQAKLNNAIINSTLSVNKDEENDKLIGIGFIEDSGLNAVEVKFEGDAEHDTMKATVTSASVTTS